MRTRKYMMCPPPWGAYWRKPKYTTSPLAKKKTVFVSDVGEYTLFIKKDLKNLRYADITIKTRKSDWFTPSEIITSPEGSLLYFDKRVKGIFKKNHIYTIQYIKGLFVGKSTNSLTTLNPRNLLYLIPEWEEEMIWY